MINIDGAADDADDRWRPGAPLQDISRLNRLSFVMKNGVVYLNSNTK